MTHLIDDLASTLSSIPKAKEFEQNLSDLNDALEEMEGIDARISELATAAKTIALMNDTLEVGDEQRPLDASGIEETIERLSYLAGEKTKQEDLKSIIDFHDRAVATEIDSAFDRFEVALTEYWSTWQSEAFSPLYRVAKAIRRVKEFKVIFREIVAHQKDLKSIGETMPSDDKARTKVRQLLKRRDKLWEQIESKGVDVEVNQFLVKCARNQTTLEDLTPTVSAWLEQYDAKSNFNLRLAKD